MTATRPERGSSVTVNLHAQDSPMGLADATAIVTGYGPDLDDETPVLDLHVLPASSPALSLSSVPFVATRRDATILRRDHGFIYAAWTAGDESSDDDIRAEMTAAADEQPAPPAPVKSAARGKPRTPRATSGRRTR